MNAYLRKKDVDAASLPQLLSWLQGLAFGRSSAAERRQTLWVIRRIGDIAGQPIDAATAEQIRQAEYPHGL